MSIMKNMVTFKDMYRIFYTKKLLTLFGILLLWVFIWFRFIRERLPQDIPFQLTLGSFLSLLCIILVYVHVIYKILWPETSAGIAKTVNPYIAPFRNILLILNDVMLSNIYIQKTLRFCINCCTTILSIPIKYYKNLFLYLNFFILPKFILLLCFVLDCFYYKQLYFIYSCIILISMPLFFRYLLYYSEYLRDKDVLLLEKDFIIEITSEDIIYDKNDYDEEGFLKPNTPHFSTDPSDLDYDSDVDIFFGGRSEYKYLEISKFILYQSDALFFDTELYQYKILFREERQDLLTLNIGPIRHVLSKQEGKTLLSFHIKNNTLRDAINYGRKYYIFPNAKYTITQKMEVIINFLFVICWGYILIKSIHTLPPDALMSLIPSYENPFL